MYTKDNTENTKTQEKLYEIKVIPLKDYVPPPWYEGRFKDCGDFLTEVTMDRRCHTHVKKIDATHYRVISTGEIRKYQPMTEDERAKARRSSLWRAFEGLCAVLRANFDAGAQNALFITLTYAENMQDRARLYTDFKKFMLRLKYAYPDINFEYVAVMEPQERGAWHVHLMLKSVNRDSLFLPYDEVNKTWGFGMTDTRRLKSDDVGRYYTAYFTGLINGASYSNDELEFLELEETSSDILEAEQDIVAGGTLSKSYIKGARLNMYPKGMKLYRCSSGITRPEVFEAVRGEHDPDEMNLEYYRAFSVERHWLKASGKFKAGDVEPLNRIYKATYRKLNVQSEPFNWQSNCVIQAKLNLIGGLGNVEQTQPKQEFIDASAYFS